MEKIEEIKEELKQILSEKRYIHSIGVMEMCEHLAKKHNVNVEEAMLAGLLHDNAKEMAEEELLKYVKENNIEVTEVEVKNIKLLHGKVGADIATKKYGISKEVADAIKYHTSTNVKMDKLAKVVFISDKVEPNRISENYDIEYERFVAEKDLDKAIVIILNSQIKRLIDKNKLISPESLELRNNIIIENLK